MKVGDKVRVLYTDAVGTKLVFNGTIKSPRGEGWLVDLGGVAIVFNPSEILETNHEEVERQRD